MTAQEYARRVQKAGPHSPLLADCLWAFCVGGGICLLGEGLRQLFLRQGADAETAGTLTSCTLILLSAVLTTLGVCGTRIGWIRLVFPQNRTFETIMAVYPISLAVTALLLFAALLCCRPARRCAEMERT